MGLRSGKSRCSIHTTLGILVVDIRPEWSLRWAIWFAAGIRQQAWSDAPIVQITPNCDWETGFFGGVKPGKRRGSYIHFKPASAVGMPVTDEFLESKAVRSFLKRIRAGSSTEEQESAASAWQLHVFDKDTAAPKVILHNSGPTVDVPRIGALDHAASAATLARLEAAPVAHGDVPDPPLAIERIVLDEASDALAPKRHLVPAGTCMHLAAVIVAMDDRISPDELRQVAATLVQIGMPEDQVKDRFIAICQKVAREGREAWTEKLCEMLGTPGQGGPTMALSTDHLTRLLQQLVAAGGGDVNEKRKIVRRFLTALRGS